MSKVAVKIAHGSLNKIVKELNAPKYHRRVGELIVREMIKSLDKGVSPVRGVRRFAQYSDSYREQIKKGYYKNYNKRINPRNLRLSGKMLGELQYKTVGGRLQVGIFNPDEREKAGYHQSGTRFMPQRRFIPARKGEKVTVTIDRALRNLYIEIINRLIK